MRFLWGRQIPGRRIEALSQSVRRVWGNMQNPSTSLTANARLITNRRILHQMRRIFCTYRGDKERNAKGESSGSHCRGRREHSGHPHLSWGGASVEQKITQPGTTKAPSQSSIQRSQFPPPNIGRRKGLVNENSLDDVLYWRLRPSELAWGECTSFADLA